MPFIPRRSLPSITVPPYDQAQWYRFGGSTPAVVARPVPQQPAISAAALFFGGLVIAGLGYAIYSALSQTDRPQRRCSVCGSTHHNRARCPHDGERVPFSPSIPKSARCECCSRYGRKIHRHHTRGRADTSDSLDVCTRCHLDCCHRGHTQNIGIKPLTCLFTGRPAHWRVV